MFNTPTGLAPGPVIPRKVSAANPQGAWTERPVLLWQGLTTRGLCSVWQMDVCFSESAGSGGWFESCSVIDWLCALGPLSLSGLSVSGPGTDACQRAVMQTKCEVPGPEGLLREQLSCWWGCVMMWGQEATGDPFLADRN